MQVRNARRNKASPSRVVGLIAAFGLAALVPLLVVSAWNAAGFDKDGADMTCIQDADPWPTGVPLEGSQVRGDFTWVPLGFRCVWQADNGELVTVHQNWSATALLAASLLSGIATALVLRATRSPPGSIRAAPRAPASCRSYRA